MQSSEIIRCSSSIVLVAIIFIISCSIFHPLEAKNAGFSTQLIHRDSPISPLFNPNLTHFQRLELAVQRSMFRIQQIGSTNLIPDGGEYLMKIEFGSPPVEYFLLLDTGSDLTWIQCEPCIHCYRSEHPPFKPKMSRTFRFEMCEKNKPCRYELQYLDHSYSRGERARETIGVGSGPQKVSFQNFLFGCGHDNGGHFPYKGSGVVGFRHAKDSFIFQLMSPSHGKFSYCLAPVTSNPGRIRFADEAVVSGPGVMTTRLYLEFHYSVTLDGITVGHEKLKYVHFSSNDSRKVGNEGKMLIDSGSMCVYLPLPFQLHVEEEVKKSIKLRPERRGPYTLCYSGLRNEDIPRIIFHFPGAELEPNPSRMFIEISNSTRCLTILRTDGSPIYGNLAQTDFLVGFDLVQEKVSFKQIDCSAH